jgi:hypothetical protein
MSVGDYWKALTAAALLGTERQAVPSAAGTALEGLLAEGDTKEATLLNAAALASMYRRSGMVPPPSAHPPLPLAPADVWPLNTQAQHDCLEAVLQGKYQQLIEELLGHMVRARVRPYRGWVFKVIEAAHGNARLRPLALQVMDERGRWLAQYVPFGGWVTPSQLSESLWEEGRLEERLAYLGQVRKEDAAKARGMVEAVWSQESHEVRAKMLDELGQGLSMDDEPFLETCLDDKRKEVRTTAQSLLNQMPESRLVQRMIERVRPLLRIEAAKPQGIFGGIISGITGKKGEGKIEVVLPEKFEKDWGRDGIEQKNMPYGLGEKAWWLQQMVERVPPSLWGEAKEAIATASKDKEWKEVLLNAWCGAASRFREAAWAEALINHLSHQDYRIAGLLMAFTAEQLHAQTLHRLKSGNGTLNPRGTEWAFLQVCPKPWSAELQQALSKRVITSLQSWQKMEKPDWTIHSFLQELGLVLPVSMLPQISPSMRQAFAAPEHPLKESFGAVIDRLEFRQNMQQVFEVA